MLINVRTSKPGRSLWDPHTTHEPRAMGTRFTLDCSGALPSSIQGTHTDQHAGHPCFTNGSHRNIIRCTSGARAKLLRDVNSLQMDIA
ncbi:hypothetical protein AVEN_18255-1 [Araneus ventricosus]|uniref:Uncharacterized protein n=1 Tax=Araneus ventricosus TaxID=182803 RepID=A0A4Y2AL69_ARAVE|nr:hypothetical protein AVEN_18255-1 [Araneus ventricosus]